jgi:hypothetical protein
LREVEHGPASAPEWECIESIKFSRGREYNGFWHWRPRPDA